MRGSSSSGIHPARQFTRAAKLTSSSRASASARLTSRAAAPPARARRFVVRRRDRTLIDRQVEISRRAAGDDDAA